MTFFYRLLCWVLTPFAYIVLISIGVASIIVDLAKLLWSKR